ncbi:hypothetical protein VTP01DRAFT_4732 [Rhizomucor pusillus]|uniref:uncharacterized protein n=1 Tax=Rhizomucor pusillus TaxID=4840 RepID=UPI003743AFBD
MSSSLTQRLEQAFVEREHISEDILLNKQAIIDNDRRRNGNREALNYLRKNAKDEDLDTPRQYVRETADE